MYLSAEDEEAKRTAAREVDASAGRAAANIVMMVVGDKERILSLGL